MTIRTWLGACAAAVLVTAPAAAQRQTPEEVAQAYFAHFRAGEMDRVVALMHPRPLEAFRTFMVETVGAENLGETPLGGRDDLSTMPADSFLLTLMQAGGASDFTGMLSTLEVQPLGHILQGDSLAHVVYNARLAFMDQPTRQTTVLTLRRHRGAWMVDPGDGPMDMMGGGVMALMMSASMQAGMLGGFERGDEDDDGDEDGDGEDPPAS